ncbi:hypothetical protein Ddc_16886 [Ditylenchus destructor]|nr:hypothetical protein Ddc_16886 [Ditylenchus destructor]
MEGRNRQLSLSTETIAEILRHFSREKLSQELYLVNRKLWQIATSRHLVPNLHLIKDLCIDTRDRGEIVHYSFDDIQEHVKDFNPDTNSGYGNIIRIGSAINSKSYTFPVSYFVQKMPIPEPFIRFGNVGIKHCEDDALIEFLRNAKQSFSGCDLRVNFHDSLDNDVQKNLTYLLANAFIRPAQIVIYVNCNSGLQQILRTEGVSNCNKLEFRTLQESNYSHEFHSALLNWLQNYCCEEKRMIQAGSKFLVLWNYPEKMILSMVEHLKQEFQDDNSPLSAFLITFHIAAPNLDGEQLNFPLSKVHTGEKLSFFKGKDSKRHYKTFVYRLWRRRVTDKPVGSSSRRACMPYDISEPNQIVPAQNLLKMEKRNRQISLPPETIANILCHLSRKKISRDLSHVNRNIWQIATSSHLVPNVHSVKEMYIDTRDIERRYSVHDIQEHVRDFNPDTNSGYGNLIGIDNNSKYYRFPVSYFVKKLPALGPFVRFSNVRIEHCKDDALIEFLCNVEQSFIGCHVKINFHNSISNDSVNKLAYLIGNAFNRAKKIALNEKKCFSHDYTQELHCALLNWLNDDGREETALVQSESKQLVLGQYPRKMILDMVEHVKQAFEDENSPPAAFLVTFLGSEAGLFEPCLEGEHDFSLANTCTAEKLSFFKTTMQDDRFYRLWRRKVLKKVTDWMTEWIVPAQNLLKMEKRNRQISLPTDTTADILCHLSRKKLSRDLYVVNRDIWKIATSHHLVPNAHSIKELYIDTRDMRRRYFDDIQEHVRDFDPKTFSACGNLIRIDNISKNYQYPVSYFLKKLPAPDFVRFGKVRIEQCDDESLIEFLINAKDSFVGCDLKIDFQNFISNDTVNKLAYLIGNAFIRAAKIALNGEKHVSPSNFNYTQELHCALLNWLHDNGSARSTLVQGESKQLVLREYPRKMILDMVEHVKQSFEDENLPPAAFLVTFLGSEEGFYKPCLEGEHGFSLTNTCTDEKLSFFKTRMKDDRVYRIWRRKVLKKVVDWMTEYYYKYQYVEESFEDENSPQAAFLITFLGSGAGFLKPCLEGSCLEGEQDFSLTNTSTGEKLSLFKTRMNGDSVYRIWRRKVLKKVLDWMTEYYYKFDHG